MGFIDHHSDDLKIKVAETSEYFVPSVNGPATVVTNDNKKTALRGLPVFFKLACNIACNIKFGAITLILPDGRALKFLGAEDAATEDALSEQTGAHAVIVVRDYAFARRVIFGGNIGFFESFADGQWDTPDLTACLYVFARNADHINTSFQAAPLLGLLERLRHRMNRNTKSGSKRNIIAHYDLGNAFYQKWLDQTMTYSSARFQAGDDLSDAQLNKYRTLAQSIDLSNGEHVLEIGCGWGGFAEFAAKNFDAKVTGLTISPEQFDYAQERIFREGLTEKVDFRLQDYRDTSGQFDKVASIEMFEAVGREYWPAFFGKVRDCLKPGGAAGLQIITIADRFFDHYTRYPDFIQRYVFPGGMLASPSALREEVAKAGLAWRDCQSFGLDYARTLKLWRGQFLNAWDDISTMGFDERFRKLWRFYLSYCEAGFRAQTTDVVQLSLNRT